VWYEVVGWILLTHDKVHFENSNETSCPIKGGKYSDSLRAMTFPKILLHDTENISLHG
jgi:hypothetical protein